MLEFLSVKMIKVDLDVKIFSIVGVLNVILNVLLSVIIMKSKWGCFPLVALKGLHFPQERGGARIRHVVTLRPVSRSPGRCCPPLPL